MRPFLFRIPFVDLSIPAYGFMMMIGFMGEAYTRKHVSISWGARR